MTEALPAADAPPLYASFPRRIQAVLLDTTLLVVVFLLGTSFAASLAGAAARWTNLAVILAVALYEPVLVWRMGGTLGHRALNLRVVHDDGGRVPFAAALARYLAKALLGLPSFLVMMVTARHQAVHDLVARSTVQVRDPARARAYDFVPERAEEPRLAMPSVPRRLAVTLGWEIALYLFEGVLVAAILTAQCPDPAACDLEGNTAANLLGVVWLLAALALALLGWTGRLPGARARLLEEDPGDDLHPSPQAP